MDIWLKYFAKHISANLSAVGRAIFLLYFSKAIYLPYFT